MAVTLPKAPPRLETEPRRVVPDASQLQNRMPEWFRAPRVLFAFTLFVGVVYLYFSYRPLWHTDVWGHLAYGRWIVEHGQLPATEPLMPLASGVPFVDSAWLSQLIGYFAHKTFGVPGLQFLYAASATLCLSLLIWRCYCRAACAWLTMAAAVAYLWVDWSQLAIIRPQLAGLVCFVGLLVILTARRWSNAYWVAVPALFAAWANLHGSFLVGLAVLGAFCVGRVCDVVRRTKRLTPVVFDTRTRRACLLLELAAVAVLANPYGGRLYVEVLTFSNCPNLADLLDWMPLTLQMRQGQAAAAVALVLIVLYRLTPRRVSATEVLLLVGLGAGALWSSRMLVWWGPVAAYCLALHGGAVWKRRRRRARLPIRKSPSRPTWLVATAGLVWILFAYTPFGVRVLHGPQADLKSNLSASTPVGAVAYLRENPPQGLVFNTLEWGDYLLWAGPESAQVFVASHVHLIPREIWTDYMDVISNRTNFLEVLDQYGMNTVILDPHRNEPLVRRLRKETGWAVDYEDERSIVFARRMDSAG